MIKTSPLLILYIIDILYHYSFPKIIVKKSITCIVKLASPNLIKTGIITTMSKITERLGAAPVLLLGSGLFVVGLLSGQHIVNNWWPFDVSRLDLVRATALDRADPAALLEAANVDIILAFLAVILVAVTGLALPLAFILNRRFLRGKSAFGSPTPSFMVTLRQAMWFGLWASFCVWLQMTRMLSIPVAVLVAVVLIMFELLLHIRTRTADL
jgi:hypothetical protein